MNQTFGCAGGGKSCSCFSFGFVPPWEKQRYDMGGVAGAECVRGRRSRGGNGGGVAGRALQE